MSNLFTAISNETSLRVPMAQIFLMLSKGDEVIFYNLWICCQFKKQMAHVWIYLNFNSFIRRAKIQHFQNMTVVVQMCPYFNIVVEGRGPVTPTWKKQFLNCYSESLTTCPIISLQ